MNANPHWLWPIALTMVIAFMLAAVPLPHWAMAWRPAWVAMVLIYWCIAVPERAGVLLAWGIGLLLDVLNGSLLGQHALGLAMVAYIALMYHQRIRVFPLVHQALVVGSIVFLYLLLMWAIYNVLGSLPYGMNYLLSACTSALLWPWVFIVLRDLRRKASTV